MAGHAKEARLENSNVTPPPAHIGFAARFSSSGGEVGEKLEQLQQHRVLNQNISARSRGYVSLLTIWGAEFAFWMEG